MRHIRTNCEYISFMELGHLLTRSGLTYPEVSSKAYHDSFCPLGSSVSLPWVFYFETYHLHVVSIFSCIPVIFPNLVLFLTPLQFQKHVLHYFMLQHYKIETWTGVYIIIIIIIILLLLIIIIFIIIYSMYYLINYRMSMNPTQRGNIKLNRRLCYDRLLDFITNFN